ncbi:MAG: hypothetical protein KME05_15675 [Gloeocapsa sp. UFS-A4-WI-NPMV-4B04]|jgi:hypothetical protein|nr:hypothetical protein [Gloeocapsa sp. UFS-A4-WI-NPMV-4B04]
MSNSQLRDTSEAVLTSMTEAEFADWRSQEGAHIVQHCGRYWQEVRPGFYQPLHLLARLSAEQATRPALLCWGFQAALCEDDQGAANASVPVHLLSDIENYDLSSLKKNCRYDIRKSRSQFKIVELTGPELLYEQGYEVFISATTRTGEPDVRSRKKYLASLKNYVVPKRRLILAGLIGDKLCGYITGYAVDGIAYGDKLYMATEVLKTNINRVLLFEFAQACRRGKICEFFIGQHWREKPGLVEFKQGMGFSVKYLPTKVQMNPIIGQFIRRHRPHIYYRLTGHD